MLILPEKRYPVHTCSISVWLEISAFVWKMENVLDVYTRSYDDGFPLVFMDETSKQQIMEVRPPRAIERVFPFPRHEGAIHDNMGDGIMIPAKGIGNWTPGNRE